MTALSEVYLAMMIVYDPERDLEVKNAIDSSFFQSVAFIFVRPSSQFLPGLPVLAATFLLCVPARTLYSATSKKSRVKLHIASLCVDSIFLVFLSLFRLPHPRIRLSFYWANTTSGLHVCCTVPHVWWTGRSRQWRPQWWQPSWASWRESRPCVGCSRAGHLQPLVENLRAQYHERTQYDVMHVHNHSNLAGHDLVPWILSVHLNVPSIYDLAAFLSLRPAEGKKTSDAAWLMNIFKGGQSKSTGLVESSISYISFAKSQNGKRLNFSTKNTTSNGFIAPALSGMPCVPVSGTNDLVQANGCNVMSSKSVILHTKLRKSCSGLSRRPTKAQHSWSLKDCTASDLSAVATSDLSAVATSCSVGWRCQHYQSGRLLRVRNATATSQQFWVEQTCTQGQKYWAPKSLQLHLLRSR